MAYIFPEIITTGFLDSVDNSKKLIFDTSTITTGTTVILSIPNSSAQIVNTAMAQTLTNKSLVDNSTSIINNSDNTKILRFDVSGVTTATTRTLTVPDFSGTIILDSGIQTIGGNKTLSGTTNLSALTASLPLQLDASKNIISSQISLTAGVSGILPIANGGTNSNTILNNNRLIRSTAGSIVEAVALADGQLFIGSTGNFPSATTLTGTANQIIVTNGAGSITLSTPQNIATTSTPTFASETLTAVTNQLTLGTTNTVTINSTAPAASRTYTLPDSGANSSFVLTDGNQTINGNKTFSGTTNLSALTASLPLQLDASKNIVSTAIDLATAQVTGTLPIVRGGTNSATALQNSKLMISLGGSIIESTSTQASHSATIGIDGSLAVNVQQERAAAGAGNTLTVQSGGTIGVTIGGSSITNTAGTINFVIVSYTLTGAGTGNIATASCTYNVENLYERNLTIL